MVEPAGHYELAIEREGWLFVAGQTGEDVTGRLGDLEAQTRQAITNVEDIIRTFRGRLEDVVRMTCFLRDIEDFPVFDAAYRSRLGTVRPVRTTVGSTGLPAGELVEIEATAYVGGALRDADTLDSYHDQEERP